MQIRIARVVCIFFMMSVHVNPGLSSPSVVTAGWATWLGLAWGDLLGRASVAALSFVSGYLLWRTATGITLGQLALRRFRTLILPMLAWNLIFCLLQLIEAVATGRPEASVLLTSGTDWLSVLTGLTGPTANLSLFFLRDLFVSLLLVHASQPLLARAPGLTLTALAALTILEVGWPIVARPSILLFVAAGYAWAGLGLRLAAPAGSGWIVAGLLGAGGFGEATLILADDVPDAVRALADLMRRIALVIVALSASAALTRVAWVRTVAVPLERRIFETYLLHLPLFGMLWVVWTHAVGGPQESSYVLFFLAAPVVALGAGLGFGALGDRMPAWLQLALRGKAYKPTEPRCTSLEVPDAHPSRPVGKDATPG